jgi:hypothetical protein
LLEEVWDSTGAHFNAVKRGEGKRIQQYTERGVLESLYLWDRSVKLSVSTVSI